MSGMELIIVFFAAVPKRASGRIKEAGITAKQTRQPQPDDPTDDEGPDFQVRMYFTPSAWATMPWLAKRHAQTAMEEYQGATSNGMVSLFYDIYCVQYYLVPLIEKFNFQVKLSLFRSSCQEETMLQLRVRQQIILAPVKTMIRWNLKLPAVMV